LEGTDLLAETSWWCAGLEEEVARNSNGRPGVPGTCCSTDLRLWAEAVEEDEEEVVEASLWW
jgi:hypothetical protein